MLIVTGAAGFIGSCLVKALNENGHTDIILVDDFSNEQKKQESNSKMKLLSLILNHESKSERNFKN